MTATDLIGRCFIVAANGHSQREGIVLRVVGDLALVQYLGQLELALVPIASMIERNGYIFFAE